MSMSFSCVAFVGKCGQNHLWVSKSFINFTFSYVYVVLLFGRLDIYGFLIVAFFSSQKLWIYDQKLQLLSFSNLVQDSL
ncbi:hypothetical protein YC2023_025072 [Brassica napus]